MPKAFKKLQDSKKRTKGKVIELPRWLECVNIVSSGHFSVALSALYVRKHFNKDEKKLVKEMVNSIKSEFKKMLEENSWMDANTKEKALEKAKKMKQAVGFADEYMDDSKIEEYYATLPPDIDEGQFFETTLKLEIAINDQNTKLFDTKVLAQFPTPATVGAFYDPSNNRFLIPAGIMQINFFNAERPNYLNYATLGSIIGSLVMKSLTALTIKEVFTMRKESKVIGGSRKQKKSSTTK